MPGMSGRELAQQLTQTRPDLRVLYTSGYTAHTITRHGVLESKLVFLQKPFTIDALARKVRETLDARPGTHAPYPGRRPPRRSLGPRPGHPDCRRSSGAIASWRR